MYDVAIVGAGPVGLCMAAHLLRAGLHIVVLEKRDSPSEHSRAIGIHPPSLRIFDELGIADQIVAAGVRIREGIMMSQGRQWASLSFERASKRFPFVLSLPQKVTESILEGAVREIAPETVRRGAIVSAVRDLGSHVELDVTDNRNARHEIRARFVVGADGPGSIVRRDAAIAQRGTDYPDAYLMGDFPEGSTHDARALLFCEREGIVESFPLPGRVRRWVAHTGRIHNENDPRVLCSHVEKRTGITLNPSEQLMISAFRARRRLVTRMTQGNIALVGDAAHEVSPFGGQGMNLGWIDAYCLSRVLAERLPSRELQHALIRYDHARRKAARHAGRAAWLNMALGRPVPSALLTPRNVAFAALAHSPLRESLAKSFAMNKAGMATTPYAPVL